MIIGLRLEKTWMFMLVIIWFIWGGGSGFPDEEICFTQIKLRFLFMPRPVYFINTSLIKLSEQSFQNTNKMTSSSAYTFLVIPAWFANFHGYRNHLGTLCMYLRSTFSDSDIVCTWWSSNIYLISSPGNYKTVAWKLAWSCMVLHASVAYSIRATIP